MSEPVDENDPFRVLGEFLDQARRGLMASEVTLDEVIAYFETEVLSSGEPLGDAITRWVLGKWLIGLSASEEALRQLQLAEASLLPLLEGNDRLRAVSYLALVLAEQSKVQTSAEALVGLARALRLLQLEAGVAAEAGDAGPPRSRRNDRGPLLRLARETASRDKSEELGVPLSVVCASLCRTLLFAPTLTPRLVLEASHWFQIAFDGLVSLPAGSEARAGVVMECSPLFFSLMSAVASLESETGDDLEERFEHLKPSIDFFGEDVGLSEVASTYARAVRVLSPSHVLSQLVELTSKLEEEQVRSVLRELGPEANDLDQALGRFLSGRLEVEAGRAGPGLRMLEEAWATLSQLLPAGHVWRSLVQGWIARAAREGGDLARELSSFLSALADLLVEDWPTSVYLWQFYSLGSAYVSRDQASGIFFGKLTVQGWCELTRPLRETSTLLGQALAPPEMILREVARWMIRSGRIGEAFQILGLIETEEFVISEPRLTAARDGGESPISFTPFELAQRETIERAQAQPIEDRDEKSAVIRSTLEAVAQAFHASEEAFAAEVHELGTSLASRQLDRLPDLGEGSALLAFCPSKEALDVIVSTCSGMTSFQSAIGAEALARQIFEHRRCLAKPEPDEVWSSYERAAQVLCRSLFGSFLLGWLANQGIHRLVVQARGALRFVPFSALHDGEKYLVERFAFVLLPEFSPDLTVRPDIPERAALLGAGFGGLGGAPWLTELAGVGEELDEVREWILGRQPPGSILLDLREEDFTAEGARIAFDGSYRFIHVASHFSADPADPLRSVLWLGDGHPFCVVELGGSAGLLANVDLIFLSACSTGEVAGRGEQGKAQSAVSLLHALGARSVVSSLWPVADDSTVLLVDRFYEGFLGPSEWGKDEALRQAQLSLLRGGEFLSHPYRWAAFTLSGNWLGFQRRDEG